MMTPPVKAAATKMADSVSFKAYLKREGQEVEVRRFGIDSGAVTNFMYLQQKIQAVFPSIKNDKFNVFWQDADNDYISLNSDEELMEAITAITAQPMKLYINPMVETSQAAVADEKQVHEGITCDGCDTRVVGRRYKCVTCPDFDLCSTCESSGQHPEHFMLRITSPLGPQMHPKFFRKFFGRPHKFFKHEKDHHHHHHPGHHARAEEKSQCVFSRPERPREGLGATGVTDMFDFSALLEFINSLGMSMAAGQREPQAQASTTGQTASAAQGSASATQSAPSQEPQQRPHPANTNVNYLSQLGQAITELLDPFGVDVSFEVRPKNDVAQEAKTPSANEPSVARTAGPSAPVPTSAPVVVEQPIPQSAGSDVLASAPVLEQKKTKPAHYAHHRSSSGDWTLVEEDIIGGRTMDGMAMEVEMGAGSAPPRCSSALGAATAVYPELPKEVAPVPSKEDLKLQDAVELIRSMGFIFDDAILKDFLKQFDCDIASVLEKLLANNKK